MEFKNPGMAVTSGTDQPHGFNSYSKVVMDVLANPGDVEIRGEGTIER